jgi:hypothetical protein
MRISTYQKEVYISQVSTLKTLNKSKGELDRDECIRLLGRPLEINIKT